MWLTTQIVYQPAEPLQPGRTYWMVVERDPSIKYGPARPRNRWRVQAQADDQRPWFSSPPEVVLIREHGLGGSSTMSIWFSFGATEEPVLQPDRRVLERHARVDVGREQGGRGREKGRQGHGADILPK